MVKNHALKNTARARKAETGETLPEAMRRSTKTTLSAHIGRFAHTPPREIASGKFMAFCPLHENTGTEAMSIDDGLGLWRCFAGCGGGSVTDFEAKRSLRAAKNQTASFPAIHLGSGVYFDLNRESAHMSIVGSTNSGKTQLVRQILSELEGFDVNVTLLASEVHESLQNPRLTQVQTSQKQHDEILEAFGNMCRESNDAVAPLDKPVVLIVDELTELSDEASIYLQMIHKWGSPLGIRVISTAFDKSVVSPVIRSNSSSVMVRRGGFGSLNSEEFFRIGARKPTGTEASNIKVGGEATWELDKGNLMVLGVPGSGKTWLAQDMARQALMNGKMVTVMTDQSTRKEWDETFGDALSLIPEISATSMDALLFGFGEKRSGILIVDGIPDSYASDRAMTFNEQIAMSSLVSFIRGGHYPTVVIGHALPWFSSLFRSLVLKRNFEGTSRIQATLGVSIPEDVDLPNLSYEEGYLLNMDAKQTPPVKFSLGV